MQANKKWLCHFRIVLTGEMAEWSIVAVSKTVVPSGTGGSNPPLSAIKGVNQTIVRFMPFFTSKNQGGISDQYDQHKTDQRKKLRYLLVGYEF